jgi:hypothetical protein
MGAIFASALITRARGILQDTDTATDYTWSDVDLLSYLNDGQRNIVLLKPDAYVKNASVVLVAGTKQTVTDEIGLIKLTRNMGTNGTTAGKPISFVLMEQFNYITSAFHTDTAKASVEVYTYDKDDPSHFYVYPKQPTSGFGYVEEIYVGLPADVATTANVITLNDIYQTALVNYILYRAYSRETDPGSIQQAMNYYQLYLNELGLKDKAEQTHTPDLKR